MRPPGRRSAPARFLLAGAVLCAAVTTIPIPAAADNQPPPPRGVGIRLLEAPSNRAGDPRARVYIVDRVSPGATFSRRFEVSNGDRDAVDLRLYPAAAEVRDGAFNIKDFGVADDITRWATVSPATVHLASGGRAQATVTFHVDPKATEGEYYGAVVAERPATAGSSVGVNLRVGLRVYLSVGPGGEPASNFTVDTLSGARNPAGAPVVIAQVHNTGGRALDLTGTLQLSKGPGGVSAGPFPVQVVTTLGIGQTGPVSVALDKALAAGPWLARIDLKSGTLERGAEATITFPAASGTSGPPVDAKATSKDKGASFPIAVALGSAFGLLMLIGLLLLWRRRQKEAES